MTTGLTYWNPANLRIRALDRLFDRSFHDFLNTFTEGEANSTSVWAPPIDIRETDDSLALFAELPGMKKKDVEISVENNVVTISGERQFEKETHENYHRIERAYGTFTRAFTLPTNVDANKVEATFKDGILRVVFPKTEESKPRKIAIK